jgi:hypothetical protein
MLTGLAGDGVLFDGDGIAGDPDAASTGPAAPIVNREERKFFRFIFTIELILPRLKITTLKLCVHFGLSCW